MMDTVYDTTVVALANGDLVGRRPNNRLDIRLNALEQFLSGSRTAWYNARLLSEYEAHLQTRRNDIIEAFLSQLAERGKRAKRSSLSRRDHSRAIEEVRWPSHDQHLLAAAIEGERATIFVTEAALAQCGTRARRVFGISVRSL